VQESFTAGNIVIGVDESYQPVMQSQVKLFESIYPYAVVNVNYGAEADMLSLFMKDSVRLIVIGRNLTRNEINDLKKPSEKF